MTYQVAMPLTVRTRDGSRSIPPGAVVVLTHEQAERLLAIGKVILIHSETMHAPAPDQPRPYLDVDGDPVIPFGADARYHWWAGGQTLAETLREFGEEGENFREADDADASDKEDCGPGNTITGSRPGHFVETARARKRNRPC